MQTNFENQCKAVLDTIKTIMSSPNKKLQALNDKGSFELMSYHIGPGLVHESVRFINLGLTSGICLIEHYNKGKFEVINVSLSKYFCPPDNLDDCDYYYDDHYDDEELLNQAKLDSLVSYSSKLLVEIEYLQRACLDSGVFWEWDVNLYALSSKTCSSENPQGHIHLFETNSVLSFQFMDAYEPYMTVKGIPLDLEQDLLNNAHISYKLPTWNVFKAFGSIKDAPGFDKFVSLFQYVNLFSIFLSEKQYEKYASDLKKSLKSSTRISTTTEEFTNGCIPKTNTETMSLEKHSARSFWDEDYRRNLCN